ncbi:expressed protein [Phakopsora pachyrhizi]|uniref:Expressed protein n=1 Tax=Phakopsora pachyrhizi TaxID=170000 RepID=A0AAV0BQU0_PHAPC|nr:expressed protein [Phakopsora pachyrhizi]
MVWSHSKKSIMPLLILMILKVSSTFGSFRDALLISVKDSPEPRIPKGIRSHRKRPNPSSLHLTTPSEQFEALPRQLVHITEEYGEPSSKKLSYGKSRLGSQTVHEGNRIESAYFELECIVSRLISILEVENNYINSMSSDSNTISAKEKLFKGEIPRLIEAFERQAETLPEEIVESNRYDELIKLLNTLTYDRKNYGLIKKFSKSLELQVINTLDLSDRNLTDDEFKRFKNSIRVNVELMRALLVIGGNNAISGLTKSKDVLELLAVELQSITKNITRYHDFKKEYFLLKSSYKSIFQSDTHHLSSIFNSFDSKDYERWNYLLDHYIVLESNLMKNTELKNLIRQNFPLSRISDKEQVKIRRLLTEYILQIQSFPSLDDIQVSINEQMIYFSLYYTLDYIINYNETKIELVSSDSLKLFELLEKFLKIYPKNLSDPLIDQDQRDVELLYKTYQSAKKFLSHNGRSSSIFRLIRDWFYRQKFINKSIFKLISQDPH